MNEFFRFPHTPHLAWLGEGSPRNDKVLGPSDVELLLDGDVIVEEKLDGANLGFSIDADGKLRAQNRGQYLTEPYHGQFSRLTGWLGQHGDSILKQLSPDLILFGEWCAARHTLDYDTLPDWFVAFDVYDRSTNQFWSAARRDALAAKAGVAVVPEVLRGKTTYNALQDIVANTSSHYRDGALEGVVVRRDSEEWCENRGKLVRADFTEAIEDHWQRRAIEWNRVQPLM